MMAGDSILRIWTGWHAIENQNITNATTHEHVIATVFSDKNKVLWVRVLNMQGIQYNYLYLIGYVKLQHWF